MTSDSDHIGSTFESWLDETGLRSEVTAAAVKAVFVHQLAQEMQVQGLTKTAMAERMGTSRAQIDRLLDPASGSATIETLQRAAAALGRTLRLDLV